jgi:hypothetical protein
LLKRKILFVYNLYNINFMVSGLPHAYAWGFLLHKPSCDVASTCFILNLIMLNSDLSMHPVPSFDISIHQGDNVL